MAGGSTNARGPRAPLLSDIRVLPLAVVELDQHGFLREENAAELGLALRCRSVRATFAGCSVAPTGFYPEDDRYPIALAALFALEQTRETASSDDERQSSTRGRPARSNCRRTTAARCSE